MDLRGAELFRAALVLALACSVHALLPLPADCYDHLHCPLTHFCTYTPAELGLGVCLPRPGLDMKCTIGAGDCPNNLFCLTTPAKPAPHCGPRKPFGERCWMGLANNCMEGLECRRTSGNWGKCGYTTAVKNAAEKCVMGSNQCRTGLFCLSTPERPEPVCTRQMPHGGRCWMGLKKNCLDGLECVRTSGNFGECRLTQPRDGVGKECKFALDHEKTGCRKGLFCLVTPGKPKPVCAPQKQYDGRCRTEVRHNCAEGMVCNGGAWGTWGKCGFQYPATPPFHVGEKCLYTNQCRPPKFAYGLQYTHLPRCQYKGSVGFCTLPRTLLRLGQTCDPKNDLCDRSYDGEVSCRRRKDRFACLQVASERKQCRLSSPFSRCSRAPDGTVLECRTQGTENSGAVLGTCSRKPATVSIGGICNRRIGKVILNADCASGLICEEADGLTSNAGKFAFPSLYCLRPISLGGDCSARFRSKCAKGTYCIENKCRKAPQAPQGRKPLLAGIHTSCETTPCAPGLVCKKRFCSLPVVTGKLWRKCIDEVARSIVSF